MLGDCCSVIDGMAVGQEFPFPSTAIGREKAKTNPEESLDLAGSREMPEVGRGEQPGLGRADSDLGGRVVLGFGGGQRQGGCTAKWGF